MFVLLRELGTELKLGELQDKKDWSSFQKLNEKLGLLVVEHGLTLGEFATGYVFNIQARQREPTRVIAPPPPATKPVVKRKRKVEGAESSKRKKVE
jgi:hypothetical protein